MKFVCFIATATVECIPQRIHQLQMGKSVRPIIVCMRSVWDMKKHQTDNSEICNGFLCFDYHVSRT